MMRQRRLKFGEWLLELGLLPETQIQAALKVQSEQEQKNYIGELLIAQGQISETTRDAVLSLQKLMTSSTRLTEMELAPEILKRIPPRFARDHSVLPLLLIEDCLIVAQASSEDSELIVELEALTGCRIYPLAYRAADILTAAQLAYDPRRATQAGMEWIHEALPMKGPLLTFVGSGDAFGSGARNQTCLHLHSDEANFLIDCGPTTLTALKQLGIPIFQLDGILLTHAHGDHFGGVPFVLLEQMAQGRERPFWVMAPDHLLERVQSWNELCYPRLFDKLPYELQWLPVGEHEARSIPGTGIMVYPFAMDHQSSRTCFGYQVHLPEEKIVAYTGDTAWCDNLELLARDTDLFICECSYFEPAPEHIKHLSYREIADHQERLKTRHLILTHMGDEMLQKVANGAVELDTAFDGLTIELSSSLT